MCLLVGVLLAVQGRARHDSIRLWTAALLLILLECAARFAYGMKISDLGHQLAFTLQFESYLFAGALFLRSASIKRRRMARSRVFLWANVAPHGVVIVLFSAGIHTPAIYYGVLLAGYCIGFGVAAWLHRPTYYAAIFAAIWLPMAALIYFGLLDFVPFYQLSLLYLFCGIGFMESLPRQSRGRIAVSFGFLMWSVCFITYPWIADYHGEWVALAQRVEELQKFIVTVGFLLVLVEQQIRDNEWLALHDELTGLANRRLFDDRLGYAIARADRDNERTALFTMDLDGFKAINDSLGHDAGDLLLQHVARTLQAATRSTDTLARIGGDEFALIAADLGNAGLGGSNIHPRHYPQTERIADTLRRAVEKPLQLGPEFGDAVISVSASIGIAIFPEDARDIGTLVRLADQRMYRQKSDLDPDRRISGVHKAAMMQDAVLNSR